MIDFGIKIEYQWICSNEILTGFWTSLCPENILHVFTQNLKQHCQAFKILGISHHICFNASILRSCDSHDTRCVRDALLEFLCLILTAYYYSFVIYRWKLLSPVAMLFCPSWNKHVPIKFGQKGPLMNQNDVKLIMNKNCYLS